MSAAEQGHQAEGFANKTVAIPENRQLDVLASLVENRGGKVLRVPLVSIHDSPDVECVEQWLGEFITRPPALFIILTGEGLRRLLGFADRAGLRDAFISTLASTPLLTRGPKPQRALAEIGLQTTYTAAVPTTAGVITTLETLSPDLQEVAVQLYGEEPNLVLQDFLRAQGATVRVVAPYVYASRSEESQVIGFIGKLAAGEVDIVAFTSQPQYLRLSAVAKTHGLGEELRTGLNRTAIAAVGPVVRDQLENAGFRVAVMPERQFFMKPLVTAMVRYLNGPDSLVDTG